MYPQPIPVLTGTVIGFRPNSGWARQRCEVLMIRSARRENRFVFPGGIFDVTVDQTPIETAKRELREETGYAFVESAEHPWLAAMKFDRTSDRRQFEGMQTIHCSDFIVAGPVEQVGEIEDLDEVGSVEWVDLLGGVLNAENTALGHLAIADAWIKILAGWKSDGRRPEQFGPMIIGDYPRHEIVLPRRI